MVTKLIYLLNSYIFINTRIEIASILLAEAGPNRVAEWNNFIEKMETLIVEKYNGTNLNTYKGMWKRQFKANVKKMNLSLETSPTDFWATNIVKKLKKKKVLNNGSEESSETRTDSKSTSSINYQRQLKENDYALLDERHEKIKDKWTLKLKSDKIVEDVIYKQARQYNYEHPYHSYIISLSDDDLSMFSKEDTTFEKIDENFKKMMFDRRKEKEEYWLQQSILNYLNLFVTSDVMPKIYTEADLLNAVYGFIKQSGFISETETITAIGSHSSSENKNAYRDIGSETKIERQQNAEHADLVFRHSGYEIGCVEIGLDDHGPHGTKELNEKRLKTPKMMRCFCSRIVEQFKTSPNEIKTVGIIISGNYITAKAMSFSKGSIGLVSSSQRLKMPTSINEIPRFLPPVLHLIYNCSQIIKSTKEHLEKISGIVSLGQLAPCEKKYFPPTFVISNNKKRKAPPQ
ncbi:hypothetical protein BCV71DRAFT_191128 [Rhizopus microsporus]|uniref:Uncharacterized protein n=1 Tax=Rhizopus microsporus TaxID=58291 RepID=A0A1X0RK29_RHIZD|nr:hypothetical protein BCV71DRAFT_191128 [Rhizopus microsporus]